MENKNLIILSACDKLESLISDVAKGKKPNFKQLGNEIQLIREASTDGRKVAWNAERKAEHGEKIRKARELRDASFKVHYLKSGVQGSFDSLQEAADMLGIKIGTLKNSLSQTRNRAMFTRGATSWILSTNLSIIENSFQQEEPEGPKMYGINDDVADMARRAAERRAQNQVKK